MGSKCLFLAKTLTKYYKKSEKLYANKSLWPYTIGWDMVHPLLAKMSVWSVNPHESILAESAINSCGKITHCSMLYNYTLCNTLLLS